MRLRDKLVIAVDNIWRRKVIFLVNALFGIVSFVLFFLVIHMYNKYTYISNEIENLAVKDTQKIYIVENKTFNYEEDKLLYKKIDKFYSDIKKMNGVQEAGNYCYGSVYTREMMDGLEEIYQKYSMEDELWDDAEALDKLKDRRVNVLSTDLGILSATGVANADGVDELDVYDEYIEVLAGAELKNIFIKDNVYTLNDEIAIKVVGYLESNATFFQENILGNENVSVDLDGYLIFPEINKYEPYENVVESVNYIFISEDIDISKAISEMANACKLNMKVDSLDNLMNNKFKSGDQYESIKMLMIVIALLTILSYSVAGIIDVLTKKSELAVFYACGFLTKDNISIVAIQNVIGLIISLIAASVIIFQKSIMNITYSEEIRSISARIFWRYDMPIVLLVALLMFAIVTIVPTFAIRKISVGIMIKE